MLWFASFALALVSCQGAEEPVSVAPNGSSAAAGEAFEKAQSVARAQHGAAPAADGWWQHPPASGLPAADFAQLTAWGARGVDLQAALAEHGVAVDARGVVPQGAELAASPTTGMPILFEVPDPGQTFVLTLQVHPRGAALNAQLVRRQGADGASHWVPQLVPGREGEHGLPLEPGAWNQLVVAADLEVTGTLRLLVNDAVQARVVERVHADPKGHGAWEPADLMVAGLHVGQLAEGGRLPVLAEVRFERRFASTAALAPAVEVEASGASLSWESAALHHVVERDGALEWAAGAWEREEPRSQGAAPHPRTCHAVVALSGGRVLMFGGELRDTHVGVMANGADTWIYDLGKRAWRRVLGPGPPGRCHIGMAATADGELAFLQGGWFNPGPGEESLVYADSWLFDARTETWRELPASEPACRITDVQPVWDAANGAFVFAGTNSLWVLDPEVGQLEWQTELPLFVKEGGGAFAGLPGEAMTWYDPKYRMVVRWGGYQLDASGNKVLQGDVFIYSPKKHVIVRRTPTGPVPAARTRGAIAYDTKRERVVLFGGILGGLDERANDLWTLDLGANRWTQLSASNPPGPRGGYFGMAYDAASDSFVLPHGRQDKERFLDEIWRLRFDSQATGRAMWRFTLPGESALIPRATWASETQGEVLVSLHSSADASPGGSQGAALPPQPASTFHTLTGEVAVTVTFPPGARLLALDWVPPGR